jgi:hypothetical protein
MSTPTVAQSFARNDGLGLAADIQVASVKPTQEYVASGFLNTSTNRQSARILSSNIDEIMRLVGPHTYTQMATTDAEIAKCLTILKTYVLSDGISIIPSISENDKQRFAKAKEYSDLCNRAIANLAETRLEDISEQLLDCMVYGHKVGEITWDLKDSGKDAGKLLLKTIKVKRQDSIGFVVDPFNNILGFKVAPMKQDITVSSGKIKVIPREKFIVLTFRAKDSDPRGTSILRAVYNAWNLKMRMWPEYLRWLTNCAVPGIVGVAAPPENQEKQYVMNPDGTVAVDGQGNPLIVPASSALASALEQFKNASVVAVPNGTTVTTLTSGTSGEPFKASRDVLNEEIEMAMLLQTLATSDSAHNTRAASQTAMTVLDVLVYGLKQLVAAAIRRDIIENIIKYNVPEEVDPELIPKVTLGDTERRSWSIDGVAASTMYASGFIQESQKSTLHKQLGIDPPAEGDTGPNEAIKANNAKALAGPGTSKTPGNVTNNATQANKTKSKPNTPTNKAAAGQ